MMTFLKHLDKHYQTKYNMKKRQCIDCKTKITSGSKQGRCKPCSLKMQVGENNPNFKGENKNKYYCQDCGEQVSKKKYKRCRACSDKQHSLFMTGINNPIYIDGRTNKKCYCIDCGKLLNKYISTRCNKCKQIGDLNNRFGKPPSWKRIKYGNNWFRSSYEVAYVKYLNKNNIKWQYESKTFNLGNTTYTPDFYLLETNEYIEIKGWIREDFKTKFKLFKKLYKKIDIKVLNYELLKSMEVI